MKPLLVVSRCLGFEACRYDGSGISERFVAKLAPFVQFMPVWPEAEIGLGTPRPPVRLVASGESIRLVQPETNVDVTESMSNVNVLMHALGYFSDGLAAGKRRIFSAFSIVTTTAGTR